MAGYIKLYRRIREWGWYGDSAMLTVWVHLLLSANYRDSEWRGIDVPRGALITSTVSLSQECGLSVKQIRTCLERLKKGGQIVTEGANKWTMITVCNYDTYQSLDNGEGQAEGTQEDKPKANKGQQDKKNKNIENKEIQDTVDRIYSLYPTTTYRGDRGVTSTGKCGKDKTRIAYLLRTHTPEQIENAIKHYVEENDGRFLKNFSTFLNNMPEMEAEVAEEAPTDMIDERSSGQDW